MHILLAVIALLGFALFLFFRLSRAEDKTRVVLDASQDVKAAAKRFGFRTRANQHPTEGVDDPRVCGTALLILVAEIDGGISKAEKDAIMDQLTRVFHMSASEAEDLYLFAKWLAHQSTTPDDMIRRLIKRTILLGGRDTLPDLIEMVAAVGKADTGTVTDDTQEIIERLNQLYA